MQDFFRPLAKALQQSLSFCDRDDDFVRESKPGVAYGLVIRLEQIKLKMYQEKGHALPHLHVDYGKEHHVASYSIDPAKRLEGNLKRHYDFTVLNWIEKNRVQLLELWITFQVGGDPGFLLAEISGRA